MWHDRIAALDHLSRFIWAGIVEEDLRLWLAEQLNLDPETDVAFDKLWRTLSSEQHVEFAISMIVAGGSEEEKARKDFLKTANLLLPYAESETKPAQPVKTNRERRPRGILQLDGYEKDRAEALGEYLALRASMHPLVRRFREEVLGEKVLTSEQAYALVNSPAASRFPLSRFKQYEIPVVGHTASFYNHGAVLKNLRTDKFIEFEYIFIDPPGELFRAHLPISVAYEDLDYLWFPNEGSRGTRGDGYSSVPSDWEYVPTPVYPGSLLDDLHQLSQRLVEEYGRCWEEPQAAWHVLTGELVAPKAITAKYNHHDSEHVTHGTVTLTVEPWVPAETVVKVYQYLQVEMLGRKPRAPERRNLAVFRFVIKQSRKLSLGGEDQGEALGGLSWRELMEHWNQENLGQEYTRESRFRRDFHRGGHAVLWPYNESDLWIPTKLAVP